MLQQMQRCDPHTEALKDFRVTTPSHTPPREHPIKGQEKVLAPTAKSG